MMKLTMKHLTLITTAVFTLPFISIAQTAGWKQATGPLKTRWAKDVSPDNALPEYPRPQLVRKEWQNLNGVWDISAEGKQSEQPVHANSNLLSVITASWQGKILVPFAIESALSGVMKSTDRMTYRRSFEIPKKWNGQHVLLHFGAVDWEAKVTLNGKELGTHRGGYDPFSFDITAALKPEGAQELTVEVFDPTNNKGYPRGKQTLTPGSIKYTPCSGIWQTVWLEPVAESHIDSLQLIPDLDNSCLRLKVVGSGTVEAIASDNGRVVAGVSGAAGSELKLALSNPKLWSPDTPHLYDLSVTLKADGKIVDAVTSYFGMRKIALGKDEKGLTRIMLNNKVVFQVGPLDQGYWPDGIYTAPTDEALRFDITETKRLGFNTTRKHVKVEPARWYYWCDKLGLMVWQDMPCSNSYTDKPQPIDKAQFKTELMNMVTSFWNHPSIIMWVVFNENQGQHDTETLTAAVKELDPSRLVNNASGNDDKNCGDVIDKHTYPVPNSPKPEEKRAAVLGEFGGLGLPIEGHRWTAKHWGYEGTKNSEDLTLGYEKLLVKAWEQHVAIGLSAVIYTQLTDVETECNGLLTYDREINKVIPERAAAANTGKLQSAEVPRPEHPRPDLLRDNWLTLNGEWQFEFDKTADGEARGLISGKDLNTKIIVPFCPESKLSGLGLGNREKLKNVWYRRLFTVPASMKDKRVLMHFGGVDYKTWVYINGQLAGTHVGGSAAFAFDITKLLKNGANEVVVKAFDDMWSGLQPRGKQTPDHSNGCIYTRTTGIWQSVWLEAVGSCFVENLSVIPDPDNSRVLITAKINGTSSEPLTLKVEAFADGKLVGSDTAKGPWQNALVLNLKKKILWEPGVPFLYDLKVTLSNGKQPIDELKSYFGLRKLAIDGRKILINGKPVFQRLILDQGFYPEGLWTAPSDEALKKDIEMSLACGYNGGRLHQKVFEPRFLYWADKLGYLVWGEYPDWGYQFSPEGNAACVNEWVEILLRDRNHPSIVGWCPFNEQDQRAKELSQMIWNITKAVDPTRPALETSGWTHTLPNPEVLDAHDYEGSPGVLRNRWMERLSALPEDLPAPARYGNRPARSSSRIIPYMVSEIGGVAWETQGGWGYGEAPKKLEEFYTRYQGTIDAMLDNPHLFGFCYTQLTDVEQERNGLYYYDTRKPKFDVAKLHAITSRQAAYERNGPGIVKSADPLPKPVWKVLVGAVQDGDLSTPYAYATEKPADTWTEESFDDRTWKSGRAPFGHGPQKVTTEWTTPDIYLRKKFEYDGTTLKHAAVVISYDEDTEIFVNGKKILSLCGYITYYQLNSVTDALKKALKKGTNTLAVHTHQAVGGQYIDLALLIENEGAK